MSLPATPGLPLVLLLISAWLLGGCGFQPRGQSGSALDALPGSIAISGLATYDPLYRALSGELSRSGSSVVGEAAKAEAVLHLYDHSSEQRILTLDRTANVIEYELENAVQFHLNDASGSVRVEGQRVRVLRTVFAPPSGVLGYNREIDEVRGDMRRDLARRILNRVAAQYSSTGVNRP